MDLYQVELSIWSLFIIDCGLDYDPEVDSYLSLSTLNGFEGLGLREES